VGHHPTTSEREELEDNLQHMPYKLEPFSAEGQVEFWIKFWSSKDWFTEMNCKEKEEKWKEIRKLS
jgi:hypothetical protein